MVQVTRPAATANVSARGKLGSGRSRCRRYAARVRIPKLREGIPFLSLLEPRKRSEKALLAVVQSACVQGVSTRKVDDLLQALGLTRIDKSKVTPICKELAEVVEGFRNRALLGAYPYVWLDALYLKVRHTVPAHLPGDHRIVSQAVIVAIGVRATGEREILGFTLRASEECLLAGLSALPEAQGAAGCRAAHQ